MSANHLNTFYPLGYVQLLCFYRFYLQIRCVAIFKLGHIKCRKNLSEKLYMICDMLWKFISGELLFFKNWIPEVTFQSQLIIFVLFADPSHYRDIDPRGHTRGCHQADSKMRCNFTDFTNTTISLLYGSQGTEGVWKNA